MTIVEKLLTDKRAKLTRAIEYLEEGLSEKQEDVAQLIVDIYKMKEQANECLYELEKLNKLIKVEKTFFMSDTVVHKLLIQAIASNKEKISKYKVEIKGLDNQIGILNKEIEEYLTALQKNCEHAEVKRESQYTEGGYDHVSQTTYTDRCVKCDKVISSRLERGTYA
jgi:cell division protein FtsL